MALPGKEWLRGKSSVLKGFRIAAIDLYICLLLLLVELNSVAIWFYPVIKAPSKTRSPKIMANA